MNSNILKTLAVVFATVQLVSCENDYNSIGGEVLGNANYSLVNGEDFEVLAYNAKMGPLQTNNLPVHQLGYLKNDKFETTTANFVTQVDLADVAPVFGNNVVVDSVVLSVPYFSRKLTVETSGRNTYELDSIYHKNATIDPIGLKIYRNGFTLNDFDVTNPSESAQYYSNQEAAFDAVKGDLLYDNPTFVPSAKEYVKYKVKNLVMMPKTTENVAGRDTPRMRLKLDNDKFETQVLQAGASNLATKEAFKNYFKGLYFKVETASTGQGSLMMLDFTKGNVTIYYKQDKVGATPVVREMKELTMNFTGNNVNLFDHADDVYAAAASAPVGTIGHENLYLKGGEGTATFIELFPNFDDLKALWIMHKTKGVLINEASLTFTVNEDLTGGSTYKFNPKRIYLFNGETNERLYDYNFDTFVNTNLPKFSKTVFGGILKNKKTYKIRVTEHIANMIRTAKDEDDLKEKNVRLGLVICEDINRTGNVMLKAPQTVLTSQGADKKIVKYPITSVINPLGTILYGNLDAANPKYDNRVRFKISYTKPN